MYTNYTISGRMEINCCNSIRVYHMLYYTIARSEVHDFCRALRGVSSEVISLLPLSHSTENPAFLAFFLYETQTSLSLVDVSSHCIYVEHIPILYTIGVTLLRHPETITHSKLQTSHFIYTLTLILSQQKLI